MFDSSEKLCNVFVNRHKETQMGMAVNVKVLRINKFPDMYGFVGDVTGYEAKFNLRIIEYIPFKL